MEYKKVLTQELSNYKEIIEEMIWWSQGAKATSARYRLHRKIANQYRNKDIIVFSKHDGEWRHYIGISNRHKKPPKFMKTDVIHKYVLYLRSENELGWYIDEIKV